MARTEASTGSGGTRKVRGSAADTVARPRGSKGKRNAPFDDVLSGPTSSAASEEKAAGGASTPLPDVPWLLLVYRVPSEPSNNRVSVWRELKRLGALYLQQCVCILPASPECEASVQSVVKRIQTIGGSHNLFRLTQVDEAEQQRLVNGFRQLSANEYGEILEECRTKFVKEIEFERFRENYTYEEAEEIREDLEKIRRWYARVVERDWFDSGQREEVASELAKCEELLEAFEEDVYRRAGEDQSVHSAGAKEGK